MKTLTNNSLLVILVILTMLVIISSFTPALVAEVLMTAAAAVFAALVVAAWFTGSYALSEYVTDSLPKVVRGLVTLPLTVIIVIATGFLVSYIPQ